MICDRDDALAYVDARTNECLGIPSVGAALIGKRVVVQVAESPHGQGEFVSSIAPDYRGELRPKRVTTTGE